MRANATAPAQNQPGVPVQAKAGGSVAAAPRAPAGPNWGPPTAMPLHGPWPPVSVWGRRWPGPGRPAPAATVGAVFGAAIVAALSIPLDRPGIGWLVTAFAGMIALTVARRLNGPPPAIIPGTSISWRPEQLGPARFGWSTATVALLGVGTLRAAGWLFLLCLATAVVTGALAVTGGRSLRGIGVAVLMAIAAVFRAIPWAARGAAAIRRGSAGNGSGARVVVTVAVSAVLLLVFGSLFASADAAFADVLGRAMPDINAGTVARFVFVFCVSSGMLFGAAFLRATPPKLSDLDGRRRRVGRFEWAVPLGLLVMLFAAFVGIQLTVLFGGSQHVLETSGLTYADYARSGFWQLAVVTVLTLLVLAGAARWAPRDTRNDRTLIRVLLGSLAALTLVIVASAAHRMDLYSDTYGLTRLRVLVTACELWLGVVFVLILVAGIRLRGAWLPPVAMAAGVLALLGLAVANPDGLIAHRNIARYQQLHKIDISYLANLSADAAPELDRLPSDLRDCVLREIATNLANDEDDWRGWNQGRQQARDLLAARPAEYSQACAYRTP